MPAITLQKASQKYNKLYFTWPGLGDQLCFFTAARNYYEKTREKIFICTDRSDLLENTDYCDYASDLTNMFHNFYKYKESIERLGIKIIFLSCTNVQWLNNFQNILKWPQQHIAAEYCSKLGVKGISNLNPYVCLTTKEKKFGVFYPKNQIAIMTDGLQRYKTYSFTKLQTVVNKLYKKYNFVQIGQKTDRALNHCLDKRGQLTIRQVAAVLSNSSCFVGGIGGLCHLAASVGCPSVITYSLGEPLYLAKYPNNINIFSKTGCSLCGQNLRDPQHQICYNNYSCINSIKEKDIIQAIKEIMNNLSKFHQTPFLVNITPKEENGVQHYYAYQKTLNCETAFNRTCQRYKIYILGIPLLKLLCDKSGWYLYLKNILILKSQQKCEIKGN